MKDFTIEEKIKILKKTKKLLTRYHHDYNNNKIALCLILRELIIKEGGDYLLTYDIQKMFDMEIIRPISVPLDYWWKFDDKGYLSRHKALNILIKHFEKL